MHNVDQHILSSVFRVGNIYGCFEFPNIRITFRPPNKGVAHTQSSVPCSVLPTEQIVAHVAHTPGRHYPGLTLIYKP